MPSTRHTEFAPFVLDLLDFIEEKLREAIADETCQAGAVSEAAGTLPLLRDRLRENEDVQKVLRRQGCTADGMRLRYWRGHGSSAFA